MQPALRRSEGSVNYGEKLKDPRWQRKRLEIMDRDEWTCQECGDTTRTLHVHHKKYTGENPWDAPDDDLVTICEVCHETAHSGGRQIRLYAAGKVRDPDWRPDASRLRENDVPTTTSILKTITTEVLYVGPWTLDCSHGCYYRSGAHGVGAIQHAGCGALRPLKRYEVLRRSFDGIEDADIVYVLLDDTTAYGTLVEIGVAAALGKRFVFDVVMLHADDVWFAVETMKASQASPSDSAYVRRAMGVGS